MSEADARTKRVTRPLSRRSRAGRRSVGKRVWRVRRVFLVFLVFLEASESGFEDPCPCESWVEVARVFIRDVRRARVDGIWWLFGPAMDCELKSGD